MRTIVWKVEEITKPRDQYARYRVTAVRITTRGKAIPIGVKEDQFTNGPQCLLELLEEKRALPAGAFERNQFGGFKYPYADQMREAGFANLIQL